MNNNQQKTQPRSFQVFRTVGLAVDPIHVGTGGARLGRVDNTQPRESRRSRARASRAFIAPMPRWRWRTSDAA
jgi:hypothetical protein